MIDMEVVAKDYRRKGDSLHRVVVFMPKEEGDAIDQWGTPAGMRSRTSAVRFLFRQGLESLKAKERPT
jgi:hypothetical protein